MNGRNYDRPTPREIAALAIFLSIVIVSYGGLFLVLLIYLRQ